MSSNNESRAVLVDEVEDGVVRITLNRPDRLNAMNAELIDGLHDALDGVDRRPDVRVVILTGAGRGFCAGLDLKDPQLLGGAASEDGPGRVQRGMALQQRIASLVPRCRALRVPVIAAVNGPASGGGLALVLAADVRLGSASSRYNVAFVRIGLTGCDIGVSWALPRLVGAARAQELMLTGRIIDAAEAERIGLVVRVVADDRLGAEALEVARAIRANSPFGVAMTKEAMWTALEIPQHAAIEMENRQQILTSFTDDQAEAAAAFLGRREPSYRNR